MNIEFFTKKEYVGKAWVTSYYAVSEEAFLLLRINDQVPDQVETNYCPSGINTDKMEPIRMESFCSLLLSYYLRIAMGFKLKLAFDHEQFANSIWKELSMKPGSLDDIIKTVQEKVNINMILISQSGEVES